ncbi:hypothetical protein PCL_08173 [Purpureocillium lilacinum]|uniref:Uncharacterized protein n=1 Tax=Purpureocillium lilacinum TaxID=33203 RepID=A0A2U3EK28_PURLI|nr:hypothetical protein PCL_08173 [Purpureocillium lilacinum]
MRGRLERQRSPVGAQSMGAGSMRRRLQWPSQQGARATSTRLPCAGLASHLHLHLARRWRCSAPASPARGWGPAWHVTPAASRRRGSTGKLVGQLHVVHGKQARVGFSRRLGAAPISVLDPSGPSGRWPQWPVWLAAQLHLDELHLGSGEPGIVVLVRSPVPELASDPIRFLASASLSPASSAADITSPHATEPCWLPI